MSRVKVLTAAVALGLVFTFLCGFVSFEAGCENIKSNVLRLHILANSDSDEDQSLKLEVRDRLLAEGGEIFTGSTDLAEAQAVAAENLERFTAAACEVVRARGYDYPVRIEIAKSDFDTRVYDRVTLPAGEYDAVRVIIGEGGGHNWWCVMFPPLCLPAAGQQDLSGVLEGESLDITDNSDRYVMKFKVVELYEKLKQKISQRGDS